MAVDESSGGNDPEVVEIVAEDVLENCWKAPTRSVYSKSGTDATLTSMVSGITDSKSSIKLAPTAHEDK
eukprot:9300773-Ditylum_brightwellii.AAC.1